MNDIGERPGTWFLGIHFMPVDLAGTLARLTARDPRAPFAYVCTPNAQHVVRLAQGDTRFATAHDNAWLVINDSQVLRKLARAVFGITLPLAAGSDLTAALFATTIRRDEPVTVIGGSPELERRLRSNLGLTNLALFNPSMGFYHRPDEIQEAADYVASHPARFTFLCVGAPQAELLAHTIQTTTTATGIGLCVGGSLNFLTNITPRAPEAWRNAGLEWLYRLFQEPRRRAGRVFRENLPLLPLTLKTRLTPTPHRHERRPL
jgi:N-acetylglucosaminyldiphosphoundecaprenol N-acetyl-beta-D-mannosaminyltransferase